MTEFTVALCLIVAVALVGMVMKFDWRLIGGAAGIGLTAATGPGIVSALASAVF